MSFISRLREKAAKKAEEAIAPLFTTDEIAAERMAICQACPRLSQHNQCKECGCLMTAKTRLKGANCPLGKW